MDLALLFLLTLILSAQTQVQAQEACPVTKEVYNFSGAYNMNRPDPTDGYASEQDLVDATLKASSSIGTYIRDAALSGNHFILHYLDRNGNPNTIRASLNISSSLVCPTGFNLNRNNQCVNATTGNCGCPAGKKFKPSVNMCIGVSPAMAEANPDKDNGKNCPSGDGEPAQPVCGNPVNPGSGNKTQIEEDFIDKTHGLSILRTYNSKANSTDRSREIFGSHWSFDFSTKLSVMRSNYATIPGCFIWDDDGTKFCEFHLPAPDQSSSGSIVTVSGSDGKKVSFNYVSSSAGNGNYTKDANVNDSISYTQSYSSDVGGAYIYNDIANSRTVVYGEAAGRVLAITDQEGTSRQVTHFWGSNDSAAGRFPSTSPICNHVQAGPNIYGDRILCVTDNWGRQVNFEYENVPGTGNSNNPLVRITKVIDPAGNSYTYAYDGPSGGCDQPGGTSPACNANNLTSVTYPDGHIRIYHYNEITQINSGNPCQNLSSNAAAPINSLTGITDENGARFASWTYDCNGRATSSQHAGGAERVDITYSDMSKDGTTSRKITNYSGSPTNPIATVHTYRYRLLNGIPLLVSTDGPCINCANVAARSYDSNGNTSTVTDWNGNITTFTFDQVRNLETKRVEAAGTANARTISTTWHPVFRLPLQIVEPKRLTTYSYDTNGNVLTRTQQSTTDRSGASGLAATVVGQKRNWSYSYNNVGQLLSMVGPRADVQDKTQFTYDGDGNLNTITSPLNRTTHFSDYDANRNVGRIIEPNGVVTTLTYSQRGWLKSRTVYADDVTEVTTYDYDGVGQLTKIIQPDGTDLTFTYDDAHRLTSVKDTAGNIVAYNYDLMSNRISESVSDPNGTLRRKIGRTYDALNRLTEVVGGK